MWINVALTNIWGKNIDAPTNFLNIWSVPFENIIPRLDPLMLGFLDEILPLLRLCYVQRDLIIGVSGNSSKSCRYFLNQSCRFIPGGWSTLITCNLINTVAVLVFRFVFFFFHSAVIDLSYDVDPTVWCPTVALSLYLDCVKKTVLLT